MSERVPFHQMYYERKGNLSAATQLNEEVADSFMSIGDMRHPIIITDDSTMKDSRTSQIGTDVLAMRLLPKLTDTAVTLRPSPLHHVEFTSGGYSVYVHDTMIDEKVREKQKKSPLPYNEGYLPLLNKVIARGATQALIHEKLNIKDFFWGYFTYGGITSIAAPLVISGQVPLPRELAILASWSTFVNFMNTHNRFANHLKQNDARIRKSNKELLLPIIPIDKVIRGVIYLAQHQQDLVVMK